MPPDSLLYATLLLYAGGTLLTLASLWNRSASPQKLGAAIMLIGLIAHTLWIGTICSRTGHPPLTNLPEITGFLSWMIVLAQLVMGQRFRLHASAFFVYPLALLLLTISAVIGESIVPLPPALQSNLFLAHLLLTTLGVAGLFIGLAFTALYRIHERALKLHRRGRLYDWIPSLRLCDVLSIRSLAIGFLIYTFGLIAGILWLFRVPENQKHALGAKEIGAIVAWFLFATLIQSYLRGSFRTRSTLFVSAGAFISIIIAIFGIQHV